jgi:hypothetical protein
MKEGRKEGRKEGKRRKEKEGRKERAYKPISSSVRNSGMIAALLSNRSRWLRRSSWQPTARTCRARVARSFTFGSIAVRNIKNSKTNFSTKHQNE